MSTFDLRNLREISNEPQTKFINQIAKKVAKFLNKEQTDKLEGKEDLFSAGQDVDSVIKVHSLNSTKYFDFNTQYFPPFEPDGDKLRLWIRGYNMGNTTTDWSTEDRICSLIGEPILVDGTPFNDGINTGGIKSTALRFNRPGTDTENEDCIKVDNNARIRVSESLSTGISFFMRFRVFDLSQQDGSERTLFEKTDNNPVTDGIRVTIDSSGRLKVSFKNSNVFYAWQTATSTIAINTIYEVWITYKKSDNSVHIYVNNVDKTLTSIGGLSFHNDLTNLDLAIFYRGGGSDNGFAYADLYDFRIYREKIVSAAEVGYMYTNKWTIADIPFGQVCITNYCATYDEGAGAGGAGYTTTGYTTIGYTT